MAALIAAYFESSGSRFLGMLLAHIRVSLIALAVAIDRLLLLVERKS